MGWEYCLFGWLLGSLKNPTFGWLWKLIASFLSWWLKIHLEVYLKSSWVRIIFRCIFGEVLGYYPISSFREKFSRLKERNEKLFSTYSFYHNLIVKVGFLHSFVHVLHIVHAWILHKVLCCSLLLLACVLGLIWRDFILVLDAFLCLSWWFFLRGFHGDFFGITHPWIGKKWPCMGVGP